MSFAAWVVLLVGCEAGKAKIVGDAVDDDPLPSEHSAVEGSDSAPEEHTGIGDPDEDADGFLLSVDCDDRDPAVHPGAAENCDGVDNDCDGETDEADSIGCDVYYADEDEDGFGSGVQSCLCNSRGAYTAAVSGDCDDLDSNAHPGQPTSFAAPRTDGSYDYDCDGMDTPEWDAIVECAPIDTFGQCGGSAGPSALEHGWTEEVPACGVEGAWADSCMSFDVSGEYVCLGNRYDDEPRIQLCR